MAVTQYAAIDPLLDELGRNLHLVLAPKLVALYLYGSLVTGDFDLIHSDIDLLAVLDGELDAEEFSRLDAMHAAFVMQHPAWVDRVEIAYLSQAALRTFRTQSSPIAVISPGEPFHFKEAGKDWLINWWVVRKQGVALVGPPASELIGPIGDDEFQTAVREQVEEWRTWVYHMTRRKSQAYAILTMCRALHAVMVGEQASKQRAAAWAAARFPEWKLLIENALAWRVAPNDEGVDHAATFPAAVRFVAFTGDTLRAAGGLESPLHTAYGDEQEANEADDAYDKHDVKEV
jgi:hypothetical protein